MQCQKLKTYMETGRVMFLPIRSIRPNPGQPRKVFAPEALDELADSIRQHGILQPLSVRRVGNQYELVSGERRLRAAELAGVTDIPCILMSMDEKESCLAALVENLQRQDLNYVEEAQGIRRLLEQYPGVRDTVFWPLVRDYVSDGYEAVCREWAAYGDAVCASLPEAELAECQALFRACSEHELNFWHMSERPRADVVIRI